MFMKALMIVKTWRQLKHPSAGKRINNLQYIRIINMLSNKKKQTTDTYNDMKESLKHYAK